ncbi:hypothetical protein FKV24_007910 [Lysobacter maris]|uniref:Uncharacterized protein n=1 Tax=Marilutibacter maris TaxID=1605891 RepID=A0A508AVT9_9GAMM|nr:hypothetical protein [Lysobacter maris]KAB8191372.1 hypothetical protein FKV24_007910 [Lysobacter maris]
MFPKIDRPCPLSRQEQQGIDGHCDRCGSQVHSLDGLDEAGRRDLLSRQQGPVCVAYRVPSRTAGLAAIALTLVAGTAMAGERSPALTLPAAPSEASSPVEPGEEAIASSGLEFILVGGVDDPRDADWVDDSDLPELPMIDPAPDAAG